LPGHLHNQGRHGGVNEPFNDNKELVAVSIEAGEPTDEVGEEGESFLVESKRK
jgi:hypothetical protein